ncbi:DUF192 domain-containing protein [Sphingomonas sp.]|uniref:DUF192 domain-containing protein n=1 Tax=Sphingomonas sp. TaxID=28214 RepID=UPI001B121609|nr:DUF192 domain-containing protein [Sphingomonas sp.]MBO9714936.1 DUF192 domain-containing protein [Sphingomonas sp.]
MTGLRWASAVLAAAVVPCAVAAASAAVDQSPEAARRIEVTIETHGGPRVFRVELARTSAEQERGLMFRTEIPADGGMIFAPYPPEGAPREASFWMVNTPSALDILFIRKDGTIAKIAANAAPFSDDRLLSGEPVAAVLEINGGRAEALGIAVGDKVSWKKRK